MTKAEELGTPGFLMGLAIAVLMDLVNKSQRKGGVVHRRELCFLFAATGVVCPDRGCFNLVSKIKTNNRRDAAHEGWLQASVR